MQYEEIVSTIEAKRRFGQARGCDVTGEMMEHLEHPEDGMKIIHIAGTNGKGSTAAFVSSILQAADFVVGLFTSPHLIRFTERIRVNDREIPEEDVVRLGERLLALPMKAECTMFDLCLGIAVLYFREQHCDYVILETGLGGTGDSTTGLRQVPLLCAITNIGLDHTQILGDTIEKIAAEKAGILKKGTQALLGIMDERAQTVIEEQAHKLGVPCRNVDNLLTKISTYEIPLNGGFQRENAALALGIVETIFNQESGYLLKRDDSLRVEDVIRNGMAGVRWPGRMEIVSKDPWMMLDGAHNPQGVEALFNFLSQTFPGEKYVFLTAVMGDKDYMGMMKTMLPLADCFFAVTPDQSRAMKAEKLADELRELGARAYACQESGQALQKARSMAKTEGKKMVAFGSLYFIGELKADIEREEVKKQ